MRLRGPAGGDLEGKALRRREEQSPAFREALWVSTWALVCFLGVGTLLNFASSSPWERYGWGPFSLTMFILCIILARSRFEAPLRQPHPHR